MRIVHKQSSRITVPFGFNPATPLYLETSGMRLKLRDTNGALILEMILSVEVGKYLLSLAEGTEVEVASLPQ